MFEVIFLWTLGLIWILFASIQDIRTREVSDWLNYSLVIFALGFRFFWSLFSENGFGFFYQGLIGFGIFFLIGNLFYYSRIFGGGDAKLMYGVGVVLPFSESFYTNLESFLWFILLFLFVGAFYGLVWSFVLMFKDFKSFSKEFKKRFSKMKRAFYLILILGIFLMAAGFLESILFFLGVLIFISPYLYLFAKSIDEVSMVRSIPVSKLTEGDWLYKDVRVGKELIEANWQGLEKSEINKIKKKLKEVKIRFGIPYVPVFLISFILWVVLRYSFW